MGLGVLGGGVDGLCNALSPYLDQSRVFVVILAALLERRFRVRAPRPSLRRRRLGLGWLGLGLGLGLIPAVFVRVAKAAGKKQQNYGKRQKRRRGRRGDGGGTLVCQGRRRGPM